MDDYNVISTNRKPRLTVQDCIDYYRVNDLDFNREKVQEYIDFFELAESDLLIESAREAIFALQGFCIDIAAMNQFERNFSIPDEIKRIYFSFVAETGLMEGEIDLERLKLKMHNIVIDISLSDKEILLQAVNDLGIQTNPLIFTDGTGTVEIVDIDGNHHKVEQTFSSDEILFRVIEAIAS